MKNFILQILAVAVSMAAMVSVAGGKNQSGCINKCGNIDFPYPFGTGESTAGNYCFLDYPFRVTCNHTTGRLFMADETDGALEITKINITTGQMSILSYTSSQCYTANGSLDSRKFIETTTGVFYLSPTMNKFVAIGCDTTAIVSGIQGLNYTTGCLSICSDVNSVPVDSCSGIGCCEMNIPEGVASFNVSIRSFYNHVPIWDFNPCSYAFVVEEGGYNFKSSDLKEFNSVKLPVTLDWAIRINYSGNVTCDDAKADEKSYACKDNTNCANFVEGGYRCSCLDGFEGNPYLPNGCQNINECEGQNLCNTTCIDTTGNNLCNKTCIDTIGSYRCECPKGFYGDAMKNGTGCSRRDPNKNPWLNIALGVGLSIVGLIVIVTWLFYGYRQRKMLKLREEYFKQNGGFVLQQSLQQEGSSHATTTIFTAKELEKATNNYAERMIIGKGGFGVVYKGILEDNQVVAIKKSKLVEKNQVDQFINEVTVLMQINHRNVVKLLGCCLEAEVPLLVYEYISNGTLHEHIHNQHEVDYLTWETRLKIASESANVLSYLHSQASIPVIHRDVKSTNILLDNNYTAKVADFGASRLVSIHEMQLSTMVQGTLGYLDPEYLQTSQLTDKSDVYSFGVVLLELLTGRKVVKFDGPEVERNLAMHFILSMKEDSLFEILDSRIVNQGKREQLVGVANIAYSCLRVKGEERPSMKEVAMELEGIRIMGMRHPWENDAKEETKYLLGNDINEASDSYYDGQSLNTSDFHMTREHVILPMEVGNGR
ncbi:wall-associated receptor kinase 2-like [Impatiens glandulifera]|uniref:wall-associated receptor kinase 2-like n=1 Tax=Impatiens glandulifera TaxID=253017 RepID=UPI001FB0CA8F|nr:wall-associated receptor kinase 2-like [Impatiens glandulifera]